MNKEESPPTINETLTPLPQEAKLQNKSKKFPNNLILIIIAFALSYITVYILGSVAPTQPSGIGLGLVYILGPSLFGIISITLFYIKYRHNMPTVTNKVKCPIIIEVIGMAAGYIFAFFTLPAVLDILFWDIFKEIAGVIFGVFVHFVLLTYIGFLLARQVYKYINY